jgi:hypothetical protein
MLSEKALALMLWQPAQWQAMLINGAFPMRKRVAPQRHPPSQGSFQPEVSSTMTSASRAPSGGKPEIPPPAAQPSAAAEMI